MEKPDTWVVEQIALLGPPADWRPDSNTALTRFHARTASARPRTPWRRWAPWALAAAVLCGGVAAQQFWHMLTVTRVAFVHVNSWPEGVPSPAVNMIGRPLPPIPASDIGQVRWRVHYDPRLPRYGVLSGNPKLSTTFSMAAGTTIHVADLRLALDKAGVGGVTVPPEWDGAQLALHTSPMVIAEWPDVVLVQSLPLTLTSPPNIDFSAFSALCLRVMGVTPDEAQRLAQRAGTTPPWLAPIDSGFQRSQYSTMEEITLNSGPATLVVEKSPWQHMRDVVTIVWSVPDRVYLLHGTLDRNLAIAVANAVQ
jgi:hypothetical protein